MKEFEDTLVRSFLYLKNTSDDGGEIISLLNPIWMDELSKGKETYEKYSSNPDLIINRNNLRLISLMINKDTFIHEIFWNSFAESWGENVDIYLPFNTTELISILQKFNNDKANLASESDKKNHDALYSKLISFIGANGLLKKSSHTHIETPKELVPGIGAVAELNYSFFKDSIIKESHETLLHGFLAVQGISPLSGHGREEMMKKENSLDDKDLNFLKRNYLVKEVHGEASYTLNKYLEHFNYEDLNQHAGRDLASLELHTEQLEVIIGKVKKLLNRLEKMQQPASDDKDFKPISSLNDYLEYNFKKLAHESGQNSDFLKSIYEGNKNFFVDVLQSPVFDENQKDKSNITLQLELMFDTNRTDLDKIFLRSIEYLLDALRARRDVCRFLTIRRSAGEAYAQDFKISLASLSILAELSTLKTLKNELTRKSSGLIKVSENFLNWGSNIVKADKNKREFIDMQSAFEWLTNTKRTATWKEAVIAPFLNRAINYRDLMSFGDKYQEALSKSTKFSQTEKNLISKALDINKKKGSKIGKALLEKFYDEESFLFNSK